MITNVKFIEFLKTHENLKNNFSFVETVDSSQEQKKYCISIPKLLLNDNVPTICEMFLRVPSNNKDFDCKLMLLANVINYLNNNYVDFDGCVIDLSGNLNDLEFNQYDQNNNEIFVFNYSLSIYKKEVTNDL